MKYIWCYIIVLIEVGSVFATEKINVVTFHLKDVDLYITNIKQNSLRDLDKVGEPQLKDGL